MMKENWRQVIDFEGLYEVSDLGRVRRVNSGRILSTIRCGGCRDYVGVCLSKNGKRYVRLVHRLVAESFIERPDGLYEVNHKDENKGNNRVENLEWCSHKYNMNYGNRLKKAIETRIKKGSYGGFDKKEYGKKYYQEHKEERKKYYEKNGEKILEYAMEYRRKKKEKNL